jgi:osmotically-inducible protein OsmY
MPAETRVFDDSAIAGGARRALSVLGGVREDAVTVTVSRGWVTLEGRVESDDERRAACDAVRELPGVRGVSDLVRIEPRARSSRIRGQIERELGRKAGLEGSIAVEISGGRVTLRGSVASWSEKQAAELAALAVPGVTSVDNLIHVREYPLG